MTKPKIRCARNGPYLVQGLETLIELRGDRRHETKDTMALCRCGASSTKPFCDGTHARIGFEDEKHPDRVPDGREDYAGRAITVHDNRAVCAHAGFCTDGLPAVFKLGQEPWIEPDGASADEVAATVRKCPSGALSYTLDGVEHRDRDDPPQVLIAPNGPYAVKGGVELEGVEFGEGASREHYDLCRCGMSRNKPFCNGAHWDTKFDPE